MILLTNEEIIGAIDKANGGSEWRDGWEIQDVLEEQDKSIAKAQLKKVVEWLDYYGNSTKGIQDHTTIRVPKEEWQALLEEVK